MSNYTSINSKFPSAQKAIIEAFQEDVDQQEALPSVFPNTNLPAKAALPVTTDKRTLKNYRTEAQKAADARKRFEKFAREDNRNGESPSLYIVNITVNNFYFGAQAPAQDGSYAAPATAMAPAGYYATPTPVMAPAGYYAAPAQAMAQLVTMQHQPKLWPQLVTMQHQPKLWPQLVTMQHQPKLWPQLVTMRHLLQPL